MSVKQQPNIVSVDVGQHSMSMVFTTGNGVISKASSVKLQEGVIQNMRLRSPDLLISSIQEAKRSGKINGKNCVLCLGGREVIIRYFKLPRMNESHLYQNVVSELSSYLPFTEDNYTIDYCVKDIVQEDGATQYNVMAVALHNDVIIPYIEAFKGAGMKVVKVDIKENSHEKLIKALSARNIHTSGNFCIIDIGGSTTTISSYLDGSFFINNTMAYGGNNFTEAIAKLYKIDNIQAEDRKIQVASKSYSEQDKEIIEIMNVFFERILNEATKVLEFFKKENGNQSINEIYICGGSSVIAGIAGYIEASTDISTNEMRDVIKGMFTSRLIQQGNMSLELFGAAVGATYREVD